MGDLLEAPVKFVDRTLNSLPAALQAIEGLVRFGYERRVVLGHTFPEAIGSLIGGVEGILGDIKP